VAEGGTVFLDEIGELPVDLQAKLLRAIQEKEIRPVGCTKAVPMNARILAATHRDLETAVAEGRFRRDLYYRLNVLTLRIPPLRERKQDIPLLVQYFLERMAQNTGIRRQISDDALKTLVQFDWPGNVRELENCIERACTMSSGPLLHAADLPTIMQDSRRNDGAKDAASRNVVPIAELEKQAILGTIDRLNGDKLLAAKLLGIGKTTLYRKLKEYGVHF
jgi:two-component system response regulator HydG